VNFAGNRCIPAKWRFDRIRPSFPPWREAVTVGVTAATSVVVMNATRFTAEGHQPMRCTVQVERPGQPWVLFGSGAGGNEVEQTIRNSAPFESLTTFQPRSLLSEALHLYEGENPGTPTTKTT
jgi:hypothetical protein